MNMELPQSNEKKPQIPKISMAEWELYGSGRFDLDSEEQKNWMEEKGIQFDSGLVDVEIDGKNRKMQTSKEDFGTWAE